MIKICKLEICPNRAILDYCREHDSLNPKKVKLPKKRSPIAKESEKEKVRKQAYRKQRIEYIKKHPYCRPKVEGCTKYTTTVHHKGGRLGDNLLDESTWLPACMNCHEWIELHPALAKGMGFSISRLNKAS